MDADTNQHYTNLRRDKTDYYFKRRGPGCKKRGAIKPSEWAEKEIDICSDIFLSIAQLLPALHSNGVLRKSVARLSAVPWQGISESLSESLSQKQNRSDAPAVPR